jgi:hypothetical protein
VGTAKGLVLGLNPVADDAATAMRAPWRHAARKVTLKKFTRPTTSFVNSLGMTVGHPSGRGFIFT